MAHEASDQHLALKSVGRCSTSAFCPSAPLIAVGTMAGAVDLSFSNSTCLEVFKVDLADSARRELPLAGGAVATSERFHRLAWSPSGTESGELPFGLIAGGLVDGTVNLWNPSKIVDSAGSEEPGDTSSGALIATLQKHTGGVKGLQFNPFSTNLLASGAADGELCVWDVASPGAPSLYPALKGTGPAAGEVTYLAWNCKVQHILASTSSQGTTVVWDLKRQKQVISFIDPNGSQRCSALAWNPEVATQLITASDDDRSPTLQVWDLRNSISPAFKFSGHSKGVLAMAWSTVDTSLLLTCGKDNRTLCWDAPSGEVVAELPASTNWNFDVQWSPFTPGLFSASSFDAKVGLYNILDAPVVPSSGGLLAQRAPAWLRRPCGATFGFGGRLISFGARREDGSISRDVTIKLLSSQQSGVGASDAAADDSEFHAVVASGDREALKAFCVSKASAGSSGCEKETWNFLRILLDGENARRQLLRHLDYTDFPPTEEEVAAEAAAAAAAAAAQAESSARVEDTLPPPSGSARGEDLDDGTDFFDNLASSPMHHDSMDKVTLLADPHEKVAEVEAVEEEPAHADEVDVAIQRVLVVGNYPAAVALCMRAGRLGDALVLASVGGTELWMKTQADYMRRSQRPYLRVVSAVVKSDLEGLIQRRPLGAWRETLAMLCTYAPANQWGSMAGLLARRLAAAGDVDAAILCHICAGDVDAAVQHWSSGVECTGTAASLDALRRVIEKCVVLLQSSSEGTHSASFSSVINVYAELLAAQGKLEQAMRYLSLVRGDDSPDTAVLRDRIFHSTRALEVARAPQQVAAPVQQAYTPQVSSYAPAQAPAAPAQSSFAYAPQPQQPPPSRPAQQYAPMPPQQQQQYAPMPPQQQQQYAPMPPQQQQQQYAPAPPQQLQHAFAPSPTQPVAYAPVQSPPAASYAQQPPQAPHGAFVPQAPPPPLQSAQFAPTPPLAYTPMPVAPPPSFSPPPGPPPSMPPPSHFQPGPAQPPPGGGSPRYHTPPPAGVAPPRPAQPPAAPPPPPPPSNAPPATVTLESVSTTEVSLEARPVVASLGRLYSACVATSAGNPAKKRELDDSSKKLGALFWRLNRKEVTPSVLSKLQQLCAALDKGEYATVGQVLVQLTSADWDEVSGWMPALKRLVKARETAR